MSKEVYALMSNPKVKFDVNYEPVHIFIVDSEEDLKDKFFNFLKESDELLEVWLSSDMRFSDIPIGYDNYNDNPMGWYFSKCKFN